MKKLIIAIAFLSPAIGVQSCKKDKEFCWVCHTRSTGSDVDAQCGKSEDDIKKIEDQNNWNCTKQ